MNTKEEAGAAGVRNTGLRGGRIKRGGLEKTDVQDFQEEAARSLC